MMVGLEVLSKQDSVQGKYKFTAEYLNLGRILIKIKQRTENVHIHL